MEHLFHTIILPHVYLLSGYAKMLLDQSIVVPCYMQLDGKI